MFKKHRIILLLVITLLLFSAVAQAADDYIDKSQINSGVIKINNNNGKVGAVRVSKGSTSYDYILKGNDTIPLQLGNGEYTILVLESVGGNKFKQIAKETIALKSVDSNEIYLQSIQMINWNNDMDAIKKAKELTKNAKNDKEKVEVIYNYIITNISYDNDKASNLSSNYIPKIDETLKSQTGICYDYASLLAGMLRSVGVPTKLVMGRKNDIKEYHAWNQVYLADNNEWVNIDTTYDAGLKKGNAATTMIKDEKDYKIEKEY
ncbi:transglutaminase-like domain-containing protein [Tissierella carlieri]|uniref:transglutaminase-like domain-containing protein n=1 Tax=Tissierella TaxID=41273 RepID=UPI000BA10833|nr:MULTISPECIES: transglutaminase-like domain-containing protein [Tissierella]MBU5314063.1 transglutaminase-like domain-containing protein [Tissierella carlieri]OZV11500.1 transglutaminase [Tissierella sp. P1]